MAEVEGDLSDFDIHRIVEALQTRRSKTVAQCALSIKVLLTEIQQQLLDLMDDSRHGGEYSPCSDVSSDDPNDLDYQQPKSVHNKHALQHSEENMCVSEDAAVHNEVMSGSVVPITGALTRAPPVYPCNCCSKTFSTKKALSRHSVIHQNQLETNQESAEKNSKTSPALSNHTASDTNVKEEKLPPNITATSRKSRGSQAKVRVTCEECGVQTLRQHMARHMLIHSGVKPFKCDECGDRFARKDKYTEHVRKHGTVGTTKESNAPRIHTCKKCGFKTEDKIEFKDHKKIHPAKNNYRCETCDKDFSCPSHLEQHNIKHRDEKPFICDICGVSFSREPNLARHIRSHITPAPYVCKYCQKPYYRNNELIVHERTHTGEKPYVCEICGTAYAATKYLKRHLFTHTGLKPFKCDICDRAFSRQENMKAHRRIHDKTNNGGTVRPQDPLTTAFHASQGMDSASVSDASVTANDTSLSQKLDSYVYSASNASGSKDISAQNKKAETTNNGVGSIKQHPLNTAFHTNSGGMDARVTTNDNNLSQKLGSFPFSANNTPSTDDTSGRSKAVESPESQF